MIVCPSCQHRNPEGTAQCLSCGASLERFVYRACPSCGALNPAQNTFCHRCLSELVPLPESDELPEANAEQPRVEDEPLTTRGVKWHLQGDGEDPPPKEDKKPAPQKPVTSKMLPVLPVEEPEPQADTEEIATVETWPAPPPATVAEAPTEEIDTEGVQGPPEGSPELPPIEPFAPSIEPAAPEPSITGELEAEEPAVATSPIEALPDDERPTLWANIVREPEPPQ